MPFVAHTAAACLIDLGVGEPDEMAFPMVVKALQTEAAKPENRGYSDNGGTDFKQAAARYMQNLLDTTVITVIA